MMIVNPGSGPVADRGNGWTNTYAEALKSARAWLAEMHSKGLTDVDLSGLGSEVPDSDGRWTFSFVHDVTGVSVELRIHGIDDLKAYEYERVFAPRIYWNGSSIAEPKLEDWARPGFKPLRTFVRDEAQS